MAQNTTLGNLKVTLTPKSWYIYTGSLGGVADFKKSSKPGAKMKRFKIEYPKG
jgi:hypothetical protein